MRTWRRWRCGTHSSASEHGVQQCLSFQYKMPMSKLPQRSSSSRCRTLSNPCSFQLRVARHAPSLAKGIAPYLAHGTSYGFLRYPALSLTCFSRSHFGALPWRSSSTVPGDSHSHRARSWSQQHCHSSHTPLFLYTRHRHTRCTKRPLLKLGVSVPSNHISV